MIFALVEVITDETEARFGPLTQSFCWIIYN